jgi:hypothetical protein
MNNGSHESNLDQNIQRKFTLNQTTASIRVSHLRIEREVTNPPPAEVCAGRSIPLALFKAEDQFHGLQFGVKEFDTLI